jgi:hypothetical protein
MPFGNDPFSDPNYWAQVYAQQGKQQAQDSYDAESKRLDQERYESLTAAEKAQREKDMAEGRARGEKEFGEGSLGRVDQERAAEVADLIEKRKARLSGYTPEEMNAQRDQLNEGTNRDMATGLRALRSAQGAAGVRGGMAGAQAGRVVTEANNARSKTERDLYVNQIAERSRALDNLEKTVGAARTDELERQKFNIGQANKEKYGRLGTEFGYASLGSAERSAVMQRVVGERAAAEQKKIAENQGKK